MYGTAAAQRQTIGLPDTCHIGSMDVSEFVPGRPHPALRGLVRGYTGYSESSAGVVRRRQAPTGVAPLIAEFGPPIRLYGPAGPTVPGAFLSGLHNKPVITEFSGRQRGVQVNLTPLGAFTLLGRPMDELTNRSVPLAAIAVPELATLPERLAEDPGWAQRFARVDATLLWLYDRAAVRPDPEVTWVWRALNRSGGTAGIGALADATGWSRRHLSNRFRAQIGLAPKAAARVVRFERAARMLVPPSGAVVSRSLSDVAATCGYADHAHMAREFRALAGCPPGQYVAEWADAVPLRSSREP